MLGSGTSNGVPMLGVEYPPRFLANPKNHRTRPSILIAGPKGNVLVDCTPEMRIQLVREGVLSVEAVILTHTHADHLMGMDDLRSFSMVTGKPMPVYVQERYMEDVHRVFGYAFREHPAGIEVPRFELHDMPESLDLGGLSIRTMTVMHGPAPVTALRIGGFAYVTDVSEIPPEAASRLRDLDTLVLDAVRYKPHPNHFHFERAVEEALKIGARKTYFTHLSHDYDHDETNSALPSRIELGYDGLRIPL
jgi:phosphoribosyl 1,2-cyclic phosphate phosphodiesterase